MTTLNTAGVWESQVVETENGIPAALSMSAIPDWDVIGENDGAPVRIDMYEPRVMLICGSRGSGKSQTLGVLAEALALSRLAVGVILVDRCGVFGHMGHLARDCQSGATGAERIQAMCQRVRVFEPLASQPSAKPLLLSVSELTAADWCQFLGLPSDGPRRDLLEQVCRLCRSGYKACGGRMQPADPHYAIESMLTCMDSADAVVHPESGFTRTTRRAAAQRLIAAESTGLFASTGLDIGDLSVPGQISVIDLSSPTLSERAASTVASILARWILARRFESVRSGTDLIPITWLCVDEAHLFTGKEATDGAADSDLVQYCKIGRKPGCALVLATQQPGAMNPAILSQVDGVIAHKLGFRADLDSLNRIIPDIDSGTVTALRSFAPGQALLSDHAAETGMQLLQIRRRYTMHDGHSAQPQPIEAYNAEPDCKQPQQAPPIPEELDAPGGPDYPPRSDMEERTSVRQLQDDPDREDTIMNSAEHRPTVIRDLGVVVASLILFLAGWIGTLTLHDMLQSREHLSFANNSPEPVAAQPLSRNDPPPAVVEDNSISQPAPDPPVQAFDPHAVAIEAPLDLAESAPAAMATQSEPAADRSARGRLAMERITSALDRLSE